VRPTCRVSADGESAPAGDTRVEISHTRRLHVLMLPHACSLTPAPSRLLPAPAPAPAPWQTSGVMSAGAECNRGFGRGLLHQAHPEDGPRRPRDNPLQRDPRLRKGCRAMGVCALPQDACVDTPSCPTLSQVSTTSQVSGTNTNTSTATRPTLGLGPDACLAPSMSHSMRVQHPGACVLALRHDLEQHVQSTRGIVYTSYTCRLELVLRLPEEVFFCRLLLTLVFSNTHGEPESARKGERVHAHSVVLALMDTHHVQNCNHCIQHV